MDAWVVGLRGVCHIPFQHEKKSDQRMMWMSLVSGMVSLWGFFVSSMADESQEPASPAAPAYPDVDAMLQASYEGFQKRPMSSPPFGCMPLDYRRSGRRMEMDSHCYLET